MSRPVIRGLLPLPDISWNIEASADPRGAQGTNYCDYINRNKKVPNLNSKLILTAGRVIGKMNKENNKIRW